MLNKSVLLAITAIAICSGASAGVDISSNQKNRLTSVGNGATRTFYQYDAQGRVKATQYVQDGQSRIFTTAYGYPQSPGATPGPGVVLLSQTFPDGEQVLSTYDLGGRQVAVRSSLGGVTEDVIRDTRTNERGQVTQISFGNGVVSTFEYDETGHLQLKRSLTVNPATGATIQDYTYTYDKNGNVTGTTDGVHASVSVSLDYDEQDQLILLKDPAGNPIEGYDYDQIGNLVTKGALSQTYNAGGRPHALLTSGGDTYRYDFNGNVTGIGLPLPAAPATAISWNVENMPVQVTAGSLVTQKSFLGQSLWKKIEQGTVTYYMPSMRVENGIARKYYGAVAERSEQPGDRQLRFYHPDLLGSSSAMTDTSGNPIRRAAYFPWGLDRAAEGTFTPKLQFNFKEKDANGLYDYGARLYNPVTGRWLSPDNSVTDGLNRYAYVRNNPASLTDPTGHASQDLDKLGPPPPPPCLGNMHPTAANPCEGFERGGETVAEINNAKGSSTVRESPIYVFVWNESFQFQRIRVGTETTWRNGSTRIQHLREFVDGSQQFFESYIEPHPGIVMYNGFDHANALGIGLSLFGLLKGLGSMAAAKIVTGEVLAEGEGAGAYNISTSGLSRAEADAVEEYARRSNAWLEEAGPQTVRSTAGELRKAASAAARRERLRAARAGQPYAGQAGHVPDTAITGMAEPPAGWLDMPGISNSCCGGGLSSKIGQTIKVITVDGKVP